MTVPVELGDGGAELDGRSDPSVVDPQPQPRPSAVRLRILIVDDNPDIRETLKELLEIEGHEVTRRRGWAGRVAQASNGHQHDVALVDIGLPGLDGYGVARALRDIRKSKGYPRRLIAMTGYGQAEDRRRALEAGFDAHLVKPVDPELLTRSSLIAPNPRRRAHSECARPTTATATGSKEQPPPDIVDHKLLLTTLLAVKKGDFSVRMPVDHTGVAGKIYDTLNDIIELEQRTAHELARISPGRR